MPPFAALVRVLRPVLACGLVLSACATPNQAPPSTQQRVVGEGATQIVFVITSWGYRREYWSASATGEATLYMATRDSNLQDPLVMSSATISQESFERIRAASLAAGRSVGVDVPCDYATTDMPSGSLSWVYPDGSEDVLNFYTGCPRSPQSEALFAGTQEADGTFHEVTGLR